jgi:hypothetical protein
MCRIKNRNLLCFSRWGAADLCVSEKVEIISLVALRDCRFMCRLKSRQLQCEK